MVIDPRFTGGILDPRFTPSEHWSASVRTTPLILARSAVDPTLARGFAFPFKFANGKPVVSEGVDHILQDIAFLLQTVPGTYPFLPDYGCDLGRRVFDPTNQYALASHDIKVALAKWEPRATLVDLDVDMSGSHLGQLGFILKLKIGDQLKTTSIAFGGAL